MADISNFRRFLLSPVPEQEPIVTAEPKVPEAANFDPSRPNEINCSTATSCLNEIRVCELLLHIKQNGFARQFVH